jgi:hypothetical protein
MLAYYGYRYEYRKKKRCLKLDNSHGKMQFLLTGKGAIGIYPPLLIFRGWIVFFCGKRDSECSPQIVHLSLRYF